MSAEQRRAEARKRISQISATLQALQTETHDIVQELKEAGLDGETIMTETGVQLVNAMDAAEAARVAA